MPSRLLGTRWALTPPFHPYRAFSPVTAHSREPPSDLLKVSLQRDHRGESLRRFIFCGTFRSRAPQLPTKTSPLALPGALPIRLRRHTKDFRPRPMTLKTTVSGLSSRPAFSRRPAQRSPGLPAKRYYTLRIQRGYQKEGEKHTKTVIRGELGKFRNAFPQRASTQR